MNRHTADFSQCCFVDVWRLDFTSPPIALCSETLLAAAGCHYSDTISN